MNNGDFSIFKSFAFDERRHLQFRSEFFKLFNHPQFGFPGAGLGTAQFGKLSSTARDPRDVQMALKSVW